VKLILKFNLILVFMFLIALAASFYMANDLLQKNAREETRENARIMMESALAVRAYTNTQIKPLLDTQMRYQFLPQTVPAYSATEYFNNLRKNFPEYMYKEATINPTNLRDRADGWEVDVVSHFRENADAKELVGERQGATGPMLYLARPMRITDGKCLVCHSTVDAAPQTMIDKYGPANGFGWKLNDIVAAQIITAPMQLPIQRANNAFTAFMLSLAAVFVVLIIAINAMLMFLIIRPVNQLSNIASEVSLGNLNVPDFQASGKDEIANLAESFGRMRKSLVEAIKMLEN